MRAIVILAVLGTSASADSFGGWKLTAPAGFTRTESGDRVIFEKITKPTFCRIALFAARAQTDSMANEVASEWKTVVEKSFTTSGAKREAAKKGKSRVEVAFRTATGKAAGGGTFALGHHVIFVQQHVTSVLVTSSTRASLDSCLPVALGMIDTLEVEAQPAATGDSPVGRWANSVAKSGAGGSIKREYTFAAGGAYKFHAELWTGNAEWIVTDESGAWSQSGDKLTITPKFSSVAVRDDKRIKKRSNGTLEKMTYTMKRHYFDGTQEWNLVLTPAAKTARDGELSANDQFGASYLYSEKYKPAWRFTP